MRTIAISTITSLLLLGCIGLDDDPEVYVEALKPDLYFVVSLQADLAAALVLFRTTKPNIPTSMPSEIRVLSWANEGGNIYDGTLGDTTLSTPKERKGLWLWAGDVIFPSGPFGQGGADKVGIELRTFLPVVGYSTHPLTGGMPRWTSWAPASRPQARGLTLYCKSGHSAAGLWATSSRAMVSAMWSRRI